MHMPYLIKKRGRWGSGVLLYLCWNAMKTCHAQELFSWAEEHFWLAGEPRQSAATFANAVLSPSREIPGRRCKPRQAGAQFMSRVAQLYLLLLPTALFFTDTAVCFLGLKLFMSSIMKSLSICIDIPWLSSYSFPFFGC